MSSILSWSASWFSPITQVNTPRFSQFDGKGALAPKAGCTSNATLDSPQRTRKVSSYSCFSDHRSFVSSIQMCGHTGLLSKLSSEMRKAPSRKLCSFDFFFCSGGHCSKSSGLGAISDRLPSRSVWQALPSASGLLSFPLQGFPSDSELCGALN